MARVDSIYRRPSGSTESTVTLCMADVFAVFRLDSGVYETGCCMSTRLVNNREPSILSSTPLLECPFTVDGWSSAAKKATDYTTRFSLLTRVDAIETEARTKNDASAPGLSSI